MTLTLYRGQIVNGSFYIRAGRTFFGEHAKIMCLAFNLKPGIYAEIVR